jgi:hydrogenase nickel incorporation protein HypA/HybF
MHEFSLATDLISLVEDYVRDNNCGTVKELNIEVGTLSGVEAGAFETALELLIPDSFLRNSKINILSTPGIGNCLNCRNGFPMYARLDTCPDCGSIPATVTGGDAFKVSSLVLEETEE